MIKKLSLVLFLILLAPPIRADDKVDAQAHQVLEQWIAEQNAKLPLHCRTFAQETNFTDVGRIILFKPEKLPLTDFKKLGVAKAYDPDADSHFPLFQVEGYQLNGQTFLAARYGDKKYPYMGIIDVYLKKSDKYERVIHLDNGCDDVSFVQLGPKGPVLLKTKQSGCGSGSGGSFYRIDNGALTKVLDWGGWRGGTGYFDVDGNGIAYVFAGSADMALPDDLENRLEKIKGYSDSSLSGPQVFESDIYQWVGDGFREVGKFYEESE